MLSGAAYVTLAAILSSAGVQVLALPGSRYSFVEPLQEVLHPIGAKHRPCSTDEDAPIKITGTTPADVLRDMVEKDFASRIHGKVFPETEALNQYWTISHSTWPGNDFNKMDIRAYKPSTCTPVIRSAHELAQGIFCTTSRGCSFGLDLTASREYSNSVGAQITVTTGASADFEVFSAHVDVSVTGSYTHTWTSGNSTTTHYQFDLSNGESCVPSMVHVELECDVGPLTYWWDSYARDGVALRPETVLNRKGGRWEGESYCTWRQIHDGRNGWVDDDELWKQLLKDYSDRGSAWARDSSEILKEVDGTWDNSTLVIRNNGFDNHVAKGVILCDVAVTSTPVRMTVPLIAGAGLPGYIACITH